MKKKQTNESTAEAKGADGAARSKRRRKAGAKSASPAAAAAATAASKTKTPAASKAKLARTTRTELDRLFIDEGAINMLYDMEKVFNFNGLVESLQAFI